MSLILDKHRQIASELSLGKSSNHIYNRALALISSLGKPKKILDFGAGRGEFSKKLDGLGYNVTAIDLMPRPSELAQSIHWVQADLNADISVSLESFDMVVSLEVIEHLENPRHFAREIYKLLRSGGSIVISTPNNQSIRSVLSYLFRGHFVDFTNKSYPAHITALNKLDLSRIFIEAGFKEITFFYSKRGCLPSFTKISWQQISFGLLTGKMFSDNIFLTASKN